MLYDLPEELRAGDQPQIGVTRPRCQIAFGPLVRAPGGVGLRSDIELS
jgi:hypothetical protein